MGACFNLSSLPPGATSSATPRVLATRKGLRMWVAEAEGGSVLSTLKFPATPSLLFASGSVHPPVVSSKKTQFGRVALFTALRPLLVRVRRGVGGRVGRNASCICDTVCVCACASRDNHCWWRP